MILFLIKEMMRGYRRYRRPMRGPPNFVAGAILLLIILIVWLIVLAVGPSIAER
jgi:hypothetical protein